MKLVNKGCNVIWNIGYTQAFKKQKIKIETKCSLLRVKDDATILRDVLCNHSNENVLDLAPLESFPRAWDAPHEPTPYVLHHVWHADMFHNDFYQVYFFSFFQWPYCGDLFSLSENFVLKHDDDEVKTFQVDQEQYVESWYDFDALPWWQQHDGTRLCWVVLHMIVERKVRWVLIFFPNEYHVDGWRSWGERERWVVMKGDGRKEMGRSGRLWCKVVVCELLCCLCRCVGWRWATERVHRRRREMRWKLKVGDDN